VCACLEWRRNPNEKAYFKRVVVNEATGETKKVYDPNNNRRRIRWCLPLFLVLNVSLMICTITPFAQWYAFGRMSPLCSCCEWHMLSQTANATNVPALPAECELYKPGILTQPAPSSCVFFINCFNVKTTAGLRGFYLGFQGAVLGAWLDMVQFELMKFFTSTLTVRAEWVCATGCVCVHVHLLCLDLLLTPRPQNLEHWPTETQYYNSLISKQFLFTWINMYFFFLSLAFIYVPFGPRLQELLTTLGLGFAVPMYGWLDGVVNLDEAILSPLVFAQITNLVMETVVPCVCGGVWL